MPNPKKKKDIQNMPVPIFTSARNYVPENISEESAAISVPRSEIKFNKFCCSYNYATPIEVIEDPCLIEQQIYEFVAQITKKDGGEYKAKMIKQAIDGINRYISKNSTIHGFNLHDKYQFPDLHDILNSKMKDLQEKGLGEKNRSMALMA
ncbi:6663_t:CDS:2 [Gigaspora margarita]|uniref:6663_t:CDS:1 n=1 Tax=Gigaspora margarita TaxID=4874 RepID=A0ABN7VUF0_GIGMA|nr:6663_t:CDS:2 [Gigaspora margarita]